MRRITTALMLGAASLISVVPAYAQRWGREGTPRSGVCFYENINFSGRYFCSPAGTSTSQLSSADNDRISSIQLFGDAVTTVYRDPNFRGSSRVIESSVSDLRSLGLNDRISSFQVDSSRGARRNPNGSYPNGSYGSAYPNAPYGSTVQRNGSRWNYRDAERMVQQSYRSVLGRDPDPSGLRSWTEQVVNNNWTQQDLEHALRQSDEYRALRQNRRR